MIAADRARLGRLTVSGAVLLALSGCVIGDAPSGGGGGGEGSAGPGGPRPAATAAPSPGADGAYVDRDGFSIVFPPEWDVRTDVGGLQVIGVPPEQRSPDFADNVGVLVEDTGDPELARPVLDSLRAT